MASWGSFLPILWSCDAVIHTLTLGLFQLPPQVTNVYVEHIGRKGKAWSRCSFPHRPFYNLVMCSIICPRVINDFAEICTVFALCVPSTCQTQIKCSFNMFLAEAQFVDIVPVLILHFFSDISMCLWVTSWTCRLDCCIFPWSCACSKVLLLQHIPSCLVSKQLGYDHSTKLSFVSFCDWQQVSRLNLVCP